MRDNDLKPVPCTFTEPPKESQRPETFFNRLIGVTVVDRSRERAVERTVWGRVIGWYYAHGKRLVLQIENIHMPETWNVLATDIHTLMPKGY